MSEITPEMRTCHAYSFSRALKGASIHELREKEFMKKEVLNMMETPEHLLLFFIDYSAMVISTENTVEIIPPKGAMIFIQMQYVADAGNRVLDTTHDH